MIAWGAFFQDVLLALLGVIGAFLVIFIFAVLVLCAAYAINDGRET